MKTLCTESFKKVIDTYETLNILVNIAGIMDDADWEIMVDINYVSNPIFLYHIIIILYINLKYIVKDTIDSILDHNYISEL